MRKRKMYLSVEDIAELFELSVSFAYGKGYSQAYLKTINCQLTAIFNYAII